MATEAQANTLPPPATGQAYMDVSALEAGNLRVPLDFIVAGASPSDFITCPSLAFSLRHSKSNTQVVFDMGVRRDLEAYPPNVQSFLNKKIYVNIKQSVAESLFKGGIHPEQIDAVVVSHLHWDHVGDPTPFTKATFVVGEGCRDILTSGYPMNPESTILANSIPMDRARFVTSSEFSISIGPFPHALDYFGDGSMYIVDAPGHLPGHVMILARTSAEGSWILLGGDAAHDYRLITGEKEVAYKVDVLGHVTCAHANKEQAVETIRRMGLLLNIPKVQVLIAHDYTWYEANKDGPAFLPGVIPPL
ncbi:Metallo-hydrolase/oxidoreductase [Leucogyrophana mollusca]|uniref:Metallo-hydrolase/oxidoreductase n=1 Tax=Leucogyrophana mollusca TaxID=85980 RepID=A0ACB8BTR6_9AGAM|nr:Metallo-hydrolase/oxidoreductase [Leucogyrophana mollusca]